MHRISRARGAWCFQDVHIALTNANNMQAEPLLCLTAPNTLQMDVVGLQGQGGFSGFQQLDLMQLCGSQGLSAKGLSQASGPKLTVQNQATAALLQGTPQQYMALINSSGQFNQATFLGGQQHPQQFVIAGLQQQGQKQQQAQAQQHAQQQVQQQQLAVAQLLGSQLYQLM